MMKLYTKTVCPRCIWIKSELERSNYEVEIINIDHNEDARERLAEAGVMSVPVLEVDGSFVFDTTEMMKVVERVEV